MSAGPSLPPPRDLPPGRLEARRQHLLRELEPSPRRPRARTLALAGAGLAAVAAVVVVPLTLHSASKPRVELAYRSVRLIVIPPRGELDTFARSSRLTVQTARTQNAAGRRFAELRAYGIRVRRAPHARPAVGKAAALAAIRPALSGSHTHAVRAWLVRRTTHSGSRLLWLFTAPNACVPSYGPRGGVYRTTLAGFVDASSGRPLFAITLGGSRLHARC